MTTTADADARDAVLSLREAIEVVNGDLSVVSLTPAERDQVNGTPATPGVTDTIAFAIPATDPGHLYYRDDGVVGQISPANAVPVPAPITSDSQLTDSALAGAGNTIDPDWAHSWWRIQPAGVRLPDIRRPVFIDGYTQPGAGWNTLADDDDAVLRVELNGRGPSPVNNGAGLVINGGSSTVRGLVINGFPGLSDGIVLQGAGGDRVQGNFIGTDVSGTRAPYGLPDFSTVSASSSDLSNGVLVAESTGFQHDFIGTDSRTDPTDPPGWSDLAERNVISATAEGVKLVGVGLGDSSPDEYGGAQINNVVAGNFIGTDVHGTTALGNWVGIAMQGGSHDDLIGTNGDGVNDVGERNVISGNLVGLILNSLGGSESIGGTRSALAGNWIGLDANGGALGNLWAGIAVLADVPAARIGGPSVVLGNTIAYNGTSSASLHYDLDSTNGIPDPHAPGVWIFSTLGTPLGITVQGNSIYGNAGLGIDLGGSYPPVAPDGVTVNDSAGHAGPNHLQNFPVLCAASSTGNETSIAGTFRQPNQPGHTITLDFYANPTVGHLQPDGHYYGEGQTWLGSATVRTDDGGNATFAVDLPAATPAGSWVSATATDAGGNTSEFSADVQVTMGTFAQQLQAVLPQDPTGPNAITLQASPGTVGSVVDALSRTTLGEQVTPVSVYLNPVPGKYAQLTVDAPAGMTVYIDGVPGTTIDPDLPAFTLASGNVVISHVKFLTTGDAPTILVTGGRLTLRNDIIQESTGFEDAAIAVTGGTLDLGTADDPGGNTVNVDGAGVFVRNTSGSPIPAAGTAFTVNGAPFQPRSLSGVVWEDFNDDGQVDFGEGGIGGVAITLTGTDDLGNPVNLPQATDADGAYVFLNLRPGTYTITEAQPAGYRQGTDPVGTAGGSLAGTDQFLVPLGVQADGLNYNFGEQPAASGAVQKGQAAGIGFWNNKNGQALIKALNGGTGTQLADWLAAMMPNTFGAGAGASNLTGKSNAFVAALFQQDFVMKGVKLDAQVLATALSVYATNATLDSTAVAARYGFTVSGDGLGTAAVNVGGDGDAFGVANNTTMRVLDLLRAMDAQSIDGVLYGGSATRRKEANDIYSAINQAGGL